MDETVADVDLFDRTAYEGTDKPLCDVVMKGGITSGVTYPWAVCELATNYRLRNIGGTSAGAIAAAAAAAAEHGRQTGGPGFARLADLPTRLSNTTKGSPDSVLFNLFQPSKSTERYFRILAAALRGKSTPGGAGGSPPATEPATPPAKPGALTRVRNILPAAIGGAPVAALMGALLGLLCVALLVALAASGGLSAVGVAAVVVGVIAGLLVALIGMVGAVVFSLAKGAMRDLPGDAPGNGFGMCIGYVPSADRDGPVPLDDDPDRELRDGRPTPKPLTTWLADELDGLAGKTDRSEPLTLGDLAKQKVALKMFTTNLTEGTPYTLPFTRRVFFFDPDEFRRYFPKRIVDHMVRTSPKDLSDAEAEDLRLAREGKPSLLLLPDAPDMPAVVVTRFSLSFPILLSAVPLWRVFDDDAGGRAARKCWFSDGGITSNFPIHFFDSPLPRWPTFGINLGPAGSQGLQPNEQDNIKAPLTNDQDPFTRWGEIKGVPGFISAILDTMQNWMDNAQTKVPGYRDRVVVVMHSKEEGGMNLNMPRPLILRFAERGRCAGRFLVNRFTFPTSRNPGDHLSWENHRWQRFRSVMPLVEDLHAGLVRGWDWRPDPAPHTYGELIDNPTGDPNWIDDVQKARVRTLADHVIELGRDWSSIPDPGPGHAPGPESVPAPVLVPGPDAYDPKRPFAASSPRPRPGLRIVKDF